MTSLRTITVRLPLFMRVVALYVVVGFSGWTLLSMQSAQPVSAVAPAPKSAVQLNPSDVRTGLPNSITIPRLGVTLAIIDGTYDAAKDTWTLSEDKAQFATMTAVPNNEMGNTFIYGHNTAAVFAPLVQLQAGDKAIIRTTNGLEFTYRYDGNQIVNPDATSILAATESPRLTLMTCEGIFSEARRVAVFDFEKVR